MSAYFKKLALVLPIIAYTLFGPSNALASPDFNQQVIASINQQRAAHSLRPLNENSLLDISASKKALDMLSQNYWDHVSPQGVYPWSLMNQAGYRYATAGENLGKGYFDAQSQVSGWMNSPAHRTNLLNSNFREAGVYIANGNFRGENTSVVVLHLGSR